MNNIVDQAGSFLSRQADLSGRVALVTGAAGHLGRLCCQVLQEQGASVYGLDRPESLARLAEGVIPLGLELAAPDMLAQLDRLFPPGERLDILINNAAFVGTDAHAGWAVPFDQQSLETWRNCLEVNLTAPFALIQHLAPRLAAQGKGVVINVGSIYGELGPDWSLYQGTQMANPAAYGASKGGLHQLTRWLATTLAPQIRVNTLIPGGIFRQQPASFVEAYQRRTPLGRMATEQDMLGALLYLASDLSAYVTGQSLSVDGGWQAW